VRTHEVKVVVHGDADASFSLFSFRRTNKATTANDNNILLLSYG
jgi:hypothetical protein